jgi:hypothetical protein
MNNVTRLTALPFTLPAGFAPAQAVPILVEYDTPGGDLIISQISGKVVYLIGLQLVSDAAYNLTVKSGSTVLTVLKFGGNSGISTAFVPNSPKILANTELGAGLIFNSSTALPPFITYVAEV